MVSIEQSKRNVAIDAKRMEDSRRDPGVGTQVLHRGSVAAWQGGQLRQLETSSARIFSTAWPSAILRFNVLTSAYDPVTCLLSCSLLLSDAKVCCRGPCFLIFCIVSLLYDLMV